MYGHSASLVGDCMIVIGGLNSTSVNSFVLQYNITNNMWYSLETYGETKPASKNVYDVLTVNSHHSFIDNYYIKLNIVMCYTTTLNS